MSSQETPQISGEIVMSPKPSGRPKRAKEKRFAHNAEALALPALTVALILFFSLLPATTEVFPTSANLQVTLSSQSVLIVIAMAALIPLMSAEYDFSVGANAGFSALMSASAMASGASVPLAIVIAFAVGLCVGIFNGVLVAVARVNSVVATLGTSTLIAGAVAWKSGGESVVDGIPTSLSTFMNGLILGVPRIFIIALAVTVFAYYLLRHTPFGRQLEAIGANRGAARLLGVRVKRSVFVSFALAGLLAGGAGFLLVAQAGTASPSIGPDFTLPAIAAAFLSVAAIQPGRFNVWGTLVAIVFLAALNSGLTIAGASNYVNEFANGLALIAGVGLANVLGHAKRMDE